MKIIISIASLLILTSCGTIDRHVTIDELSSRLEKDNYKKHGYRWTYIGSDEKHHHFKRLQITMFHNNWSDGEYLVEKERFDIGHHEFPYPYGGKEYPRLVSDAFTYYESPNAFPFTYDIDVGVIGTNRIPPVAGINFDPANRNTWLDEKGNKWLENRQYSLEELFQPEHGAYGENAR